MPISTWIERILPRAQPWRRRRANATVTRPRFRPAVEGLEDRTVLAAFSLLLQQAAPGPVYSGVPFAVTVSFVNNATGQTVNGAGEQVQFSSSDPRAVLPAPYTFQPSDNPSHTFSVTLSQVGTQYLSVTDPLRSYIAAGSAALTVSPPPLYHLGITTSPASVVTGSPFSVTVSFLNASNQVVSWLNDRVQFTSTDPAGILPPSYSFQPRDNGTHTFSGVVVKTAGSQTITVADVYNPGQVAPGSVSVGGTPPLPYYLKVTAAASSVIIGSSFGLTVTLLDSRTNQVVPGFTGNVQFSSTDYRAVLPSPYWFQFSDNSSRVFPGVVLNTVGTQSIAVTDPFDARTVAPGNITLTVTYPPPTRLQVDIQPGTPGAPYANLPFAVTVTARDLVTNQVESGFTGTVRFSSPTDPTATLPGAYTFTPSDNGQRVFSGLIFDRTGYQQFQVTDPSDSWVSGAYPSFLVRPQPPAFAISVPPVVSTATPFNVTVVVHESFTGATYNTYAGTVRFSSSDSQATLPPSYTFAPSDNGTQVFSVTYRTPGTTSLTVTDPQAGVVSPPVVTLVNTIPLHLGITPLDAALIGNQTRLKITALDPAGLPYPSYTGLVRLASNDPAGSAPTTVPFTPSDGGTKIVSFVFGTVGTERVSAADVSIPSVSATISVPVGTATHFQVIGSTYTAGAYSTLAVRALGPGDVPVLGYNSPVLVTTSDPGVYGEVTGNYPYISLTFTKAGTQTLSITDASDPTISGTGTVTVVPGLVGGFRLSSTAAVAGDATAVSATAVDRYGNIVTNYVGSVTVSSSDAQATLPPRYAFVTTDNGRRTVAVTFRTAGPQTVLVADQNGVSASASISVSPDPSVASLRLDGPVAVASGSPFSVLISALDPFGNVATGYTGSVGFTSSDSAASLPAAYSFSAADGGQHFFALTLATTGAQTINATDTVDPRLSAQATTTATSPVIPAILKVVLPPAVTSGDLTTCTVTAVDAGGNVITTYTGTVLLSSTDPSAQFPRQYRFSPADAGTHVFSVQFRQAGPQDLWLSDTTDAAIQGAATASVLAPVPDATVVGLNTTVSGTIGTDGLWSSPLTITGSGRLIVQVHANGIATSLSLSDPANLLLAESAGTAPTNPDDWIDQHVTASPGGSTYRLQVQGPPGAVFSITTRCTPSFDPFRPISLQQSPLNSPDPVGLVSADFNGDGIPDLGTLDRGVGEIATFLGLGDGTFRLGGRLELGSLYGPVLAVGDFNGDGIPDLALAIASSGTSAQPSLTIYSGRGDGTFQLASQLAMEMYTQPMALVSGSFTGSGRTDLALLDGSGATVTIFAGDGRGTFTAAGSFGLPASPLGTIGWGSLAVGDFNHDGRPDVAVGGIVTPGRMNELVLVVALNEANGRFSTTDVATIPVVSSYADPIVVGDFNGDGNVDIVTIGQGVSDILLFPGAGDGSFAAPRQIDVGLVPHLITTGEFTGDGISDLAVSDGINTVATALGERTGAFQTTARKLLGTLPVALAAADFNNDGYYDLSSVNGASEDVSVTLGAADGSLRSQASPSNPSGTSGGSSAVVPAAEGDFNGDGNPDLASVQSTGVLIQLGQGDGAFGISSVIITGDQPVAVISTDINGDGRPDLLVLTQHNLPAETDVAVESYLGLGDGTFRLADRFSVESLPPSQFVTGRFSQADSTDLGILFVSTFVVYRGNGDGTFQHAPFVTLRLAEAPLATVSVDLTGDGIDDVATVGTNSLFVYRNNGDGTFRPPDRYQLAGTNPSPVWLLAGRFGPTAGLDLVVGDRSGTMSTFVNNGTGASFSRIDSSPGIIPTNASVADLNGDGNLAIIGMTIDRTGHYRTLTILNGDGQGHFTLGSNSTPLPFNVAAVLPGDFNRDGRLDLALIPELEGGGGVVLLGTPHGFVNASLSSSPFRAVPLFADFNGDRVSDVAVLDSSGKILFRAGQPNAPGSFAPPVVLDPGVVSRDLAVVRIGSAVQHPGSDVLLAALDPALGKIRLFHWINGGINTTDLTLPSSDLLPVRIVVGALNGRDDLAVVDAAGRQLFVYLQHPDGTFALSATVGVGVNPSDVAFADINGDGLVDLIVSNRSSGDVTVALNAATAPFQVMHTYRAGMGPYGVDTASPPTTVTADQGTLGVLVGQFTSAASSDAVTLNAGSGLLGLLIGNGQGGFYNPSTAGTVAVGTGAVQAVAGLFDTASRRPLVAVLNRSTQQVQVFSVDTYGLFHLVYTGAAGVDPTGISVADVDGDGDLDLLVGNSFGDVLVLLGNGDGTFRPLNQANDAVPFVVTDLAGHGNVDAIVANQAGDQVQSQIRTPGTTTFAAGSFNQTQADGLRSPGNVLLTDVTGDGTPDLIVANTGSNDVLVYLGLGRGQFAAGRAFAVGTNPVGLLVQDLNGDGVPDIAVTDRGSDDVSILFGQGTGSAWTLTSGPRLRVGSGPIAVSARDVTGDGISDLIVTNQDGTVTELPGIGSNGHGTGFFADQPAGGAKTFTLTTAGIRQDAGNGFVVTDSGSILHYNADDLAAGAQTVFDSGSRLTKYVQPVFLGGASEPTLFAARSDGTVSELVSQNGQYQELRTFGSPELTDPSTLDVVVEAGGAFEIYATNVADGVPIILSAETLGTTTPDGPPESVVGVPVAELNELGGLPSEATGQAGEAGAPPGVAGLQPGVLVPTFAGVSQEGGELREQTPTLLALPESDLALVGTLLVGPGGEEVAAAQPAVAGESTGDGQGTSAVAARGERGGQPAVETGTIGDDDDPPMSPAADDPVGVPPSLTGVDEALDSNPLGRTTPPGPPGPDGPGAHTFNSVIDRVFAAMDVSATDVRVIATQVARSVERSIPIHPASAATSPGTPGRMGASADATGVQDDGRHGPLSPTDGDAGGAASDSGVRPAGAMARASSAAPAASDAFWSRARPGVGSGANGSAPGGGSASAVGLLAGWWLAQQLVPSFVERDSETRAQPRPAHR